MGSGYIKTAPLKIYSTPYVVFVIKLSGLLGCVKDITGFPNVVLVLLLDLAVLLLKFSLYLLVFAIILKLSALLLITAYYLGHCCL